MTLVQVRDSLDQVTTTTRSPNSPQWAPPYGAGPPTRRTSTIGWLAAILAGAAAVLAAAALIVALTRSTTTASNGPITPPTPTYTAAETAAARQQLCSAFDLAAGAVRVDSAGDRALGRIALVNGAGLLDAAVSPALRADIAGDAHALANTYRTAAAIGSTAAADDPRWRTAVDDVGAKSDALQSVCHGG